MIHVVQLVCPSRLWSGCCETTGTSDRLSACSWSFDSASFGGILASPAEGTAELRSHSLAARSASSILAFRCQSRHTQLLLSLGFCSFVFSRLRNWVRSCWVRHSFHPLRRLLVLHHRLLSEGIDVQIDSASLLLVQRLAVPGTCNNDGRLLSACPTNGSASRLATSAGCFFSAGIGKNMDAIPA